MEGRFSQKEPSSLILTFKVLKDFIRKGWIPQKFKRMETGMVLTHPGCEEFTYRCSPFVSPEN
jgi:hypothetical protein